MTNLPITASTAQTAAPGKQSANNADGGDTAVQPFGEVLARQISAPDIKVAKPGDKLAAELAAQAITATTDAQKDDKAVTEVAGALPTDMLAALMPQVMNTASAAATTTAAPAGGKAESTVSVGTDRPAVAANRTDLAASLQAKDAAKTALLTTDAPATATAQPKENAFAGALGELSARATKNMETTLPARETAVAAAATAATQQPGIAALATMQNTAAAVAAPVTQSSQLRVDTPLNQARWGDEFSQKITWLASSNIDQSAELHLNPPQLGPIDVVIKVSGDQATALFTSPHAAVREAVEQAIPKLRDMMADNGITLGNTTVSDQAPRDQNRPEAQRAVADSSNDIRDTVITASGSTRVSPIARHNGIVDTFA